MVLIFIWVICSPCENNYAVWTAGEGLGSSKSGISDPIMAGGVKKNNLGVGAHQPGEVTADDDIYEQYKKRMMLGYKHRPNPLVLFFLFDKPIISFFVI